jgi:hypothetical protein
LPKRIDTATAVYRTDDGPPIWAHGDEAELAHLGFAQQIRGGLLRVPEHRIFSANSVQIETTTSRRPARFKIDGFAAALDAAQKAGCSAEDF